MSLLGTLIGNNGAKKAAKYQLQSAREQIAAAEKNRDFQYGLNQPTIDQGNNATGLIAGFTGAGGDANAAATALDTFRGSTGYQDLLRSGLAATNANAFARGQGNSGATLKALQDRGTSIADSSAQTWLGNLGTLANLGANARGLVAGVGQNTVATSNAARQSGADAQSNAALITAGNWTKFIDDLPGQFAGFGSSYGG